jgi:hypothetical protein
VRLRRASTHLPGPDHEVGTGKFRFLVMKVKVKVTKSGVKLDRRIATQMWEASKISLLVEIKVPNARSFGHRRHRRHIPL